MEAQKSEGDGGPVAGRGYHIAGDTPTIHGRHRGRAAYTVDVDAAEGVSGVWDADVVVSVTQGCGGRDDNNSKDTTALRVVN